MEIPDSDTVLLVTRDGMGATEPELGHKLIKTYLSLLIEHEIRPGAICFYTQGVRLVVDGSPVLDQLAALEAKGVRLILCSTCLNYYNLTESVRLGIVGGMGDILEAQRRAAKVITI